LRILKLLPRKSCAGRYENSARPRQQTLLFKEFRFTHPAYLRVLRWIAGMELADQLVQPGGQDDDDEPQPTLPKFDANLFGRIGL
jgi:hypothetical protein